MDYQSTGGVDMTVSSVPGADQYGPNEEDVVTPPPPSLVNGLIDETRFGGN